MSLTNEIVLKALIDQFGEHIKDPTEPYTMLTITIPASQNVPILSWLRDHRDFQFVFLTDLCGVHYPANGGLELAVIYHLHSFIHNYRMRIKAFVSSLNPEIPTITEIYASANWMERETYDFFGIRFKGHPQLKRILNMDDMNYFPMLKQYPLEDQLREDKEDKFFGR